MKVLAMDTSNQTMTVAVMEDDQILGQIQTMANKTHSKSLMPAIDLLMKNIGVQPKELDRIVVAQGPGSYTGIRIGVTTAKVLADTLKIELVGVSSLAVVAANCIYEKSLIVPLFDARRKNVYAGVYQWQDEKLVAVLSDQHLSIDELLDFLKGKECFFVGEDVKKFQAEISKKLALAKINQNILWDYPSAIVLAQLGQTEEPVKNLAAFLPQYLKRVEAEEKWLQTHDEGGEVYVEKI